MTPVGKNDFSPSSECLKTTYRLMYIPQNSSHSSVVYGTLYWNRFFANIWKTIGGIELGFAPFVFFPVFQKSSQRFFFFWKPSSRITPNQQIHRILRSIHASDTFFQNRKICHVAHARRFYDLEFPPVTSLFGKRSHTSVVIVYLKKISVGFNEER